jgi:5-methyltetrahydrofolate--homocysteine methyltransferase
MWELGGEKTLESKAAATTTRHILETHEVPRDHQEGGRRACRRVGRDPMVDAAELTRAVEAGDRKTAAAVTQAAIDEGLPPQEILDAMTRAMDKVGAKFQRGELYVPEMLMSARAMKEATALLEPLLVKAGIQPHDIVVIGTVKGDLHDIGKNLVGMMLKGANLEVVDLGVSVSPEQFAGAAKERSAGLIGVSGLLTTTMVGMKGVVAAVHEAGLSTKVMVGGAPVTAEFAASIGADGYAPDAASAVEVAKGLLGLAPHAKPTAGLPGQARTGPS